MEGLADRMSFSQKEKRELIAEALSSRRGRKALSEAMMVPIAGPNWKSEKGCHNCGLCNFKSNCEQKK
jgi:hypothetical protein